ncbi:MAG: hypothetical protein ACI9HK_005476 [Pirellulaceae bacterium]|jgi:hypothetical protein
MLLVSVRRVASIVEAYRFGQFLSVVPILAVVGLDSLDASLLAIHQTRRSRLETEALELRSRPTSIATEPEFLYL